MYVNPGVPIGGIGVVGVLPATGVSVLTMLLAVTAVVLIVAGVMVLRSQVVDAPNRSQRRT